MSQPEANPQLSPSKATLFAVIDISFFGVIFGPLAIMNAGKAEALGVPAPF